MEDRPRIASKEEITRRVMELHEKGYGCRRTAATLQSEGITSSKDKVWRILKSHEAKYNGAEIKQDRGFKHLKQKEEALQRRLDVLRKKGEYRRQIVNLTVELLMTDYQARREIFQDGQKLLRFAETVMPIVDPQLWSDFKRDCELYKDSDLAWHLRQALGLQRHFEEQLVDDSGEKLRLDAFLGKKIRETLISWYETAEEQQETEEEKCENKEDSEQDVKEWVDEEGYYNIVIPQTRAPEY